MNWRKSGNSSGLTDPERGAPPPHPHFESILQKYWGYSSFRPFQREIIEDVYHGHDTLALLPTGGGKSITFQVAGLALNGLTLVITPLIALMDDQVQTLQTRGIRALALHSTSTGGHPEQMLANCIHGKYSFLYISPERLQTELFQEYIPKLNIRLLAIDEAHCISQWGHDFRPAYRRIGSLRHALQGVPTLALTASATPAVKEDIKRQLDMGSCKEVNGDFHRPNLVFGVRHCLSINEAVLRMVRRIPGSGIIYTRSRERAEELAHLLQHEPGGATAYHAGLIPNIRSKRQRNWLSGNTRIMVATNAFGMGIDKPNTRFVIHTELPASIEEYYQEAGRAGRDGQRAYAALFHNDETIAKAQRILAERITDFALLKKIYHCIPSHLGIPHGDGRQCAYPFDIGLFARRYKIDPRALRHHLNVLQRHEIISLQQAEEGILHFNLHSTFTAQQAFRAAHPLHEQLMRLLTTISQNASSNWFSLRIDRLTARLSIGEPRLYHLLESAHRCHLLSWAQPAAQANITVHADTSLPLPIAKATIEFENQLASERAQSMLAYIHPNVSCRAAYIAEYFGYSSLPCALCDRCREQTKP